MNAKRFSLLYLPGAIFVAISVLLRAVLLIKSLPYLHLDLFLFLKVFATGLFYDCVAFFYLAVPFVVYLAIVPDGIFNRPWHKSFAGLVLFFAVCAFAFNAVAEYLFFDEFGTRYNFIAVDYLVYTREVVGNIKESYPLVSIFIAIFLISTLIYALTWKFIRGAFSGTSTFGQRVRMVFVPAVIPVLSFMFVDLSLTSLSGNSYANEISGNGLYDLAAAFRNNELDYNRFYVTADEQTVLAQVRRQMREKNNEYVSSDHRTLARFISNRNEKRLNVIVVIEESLSAEYLGIFGNKFALTPNFDRLAGRSLLFTHMLATGTRTVRGLEAITLSMPPLPGVSIVKRPGNEGFFSWGSLMRDKGYDTKYIYAGYGYFDNMNYFFSNNGFSIVDRSSFSKDEITFANIWGVCDEDLFKKTIRESDRSWTAGKPFFSMVMTTSNHRPYTYPDGRIDIPTGTGRGGGVKYADYAVGRFIEEAQKRPWFKDTVFVFVADHCAASAGSTELPVKRYEIPLLVYSPSHVNPGRVDTLMSQIDIAPTILGLLNFSYETRFMGRDMLKADESQGRAFISTYQKLGYVKDKTLVVLGPQKYLKTYTFDPATGIAVAAPKLERVVSEAVAYFQGASYYYTSRANRRQPEKK